MIVVYAGDVQVSDLQQVDREEGQLVARYGKISVLSVVLPSREFKRVSDGVRGAAHDLVRKYRDHLIADATVVPAQGITGTIVRTFLIGFALVARNPYPSKVFSQVDEAVSWLKRAPGQDITFADANDELPELRAFAAQAA